MTTLGGGSKPTQTPQEPNKKPKKRRKRPANSKPVSHVVPTHHSLFVTSEDEEEDEVDYKKGGYHPIRIGQVFLGKYKVLYKLGWGHFSTVWLAQDLYHENQEVAVKVVKSASHYTEAAMDEILILEKVAEVDPEQGYVIRLLDHFELYGPNGTHVSMVFEKLGCNLLTVTKMYRYRGMPVPLVRVLVKQILMGLDYLHTECNLIHTDLKPENILLIAPPATSLGEMDESQTEEENSGEESSEKKQKKRPKLPRDAENLIKIFGGNQSYRCKIVDLGNACWTDKHYTDDVQTRQYRAPEVILGAPYDTPIDMWSMGAMTFEFLTGDLLFEPKSGRSFGKNDDHLAQMIEAIGPIPRSVSRTGKKCDRFFDKRGRLLNVRNLKYWPLKDVLTEKYKFEESEAGSMADFILQMINFDPSERATAKESLQHPWMQGIDLDNFQSVFQ